MRILPQSIKKTPTIWVLFKIIESEMKKGMKTRRMVKTKSQMKPLKKTSLFSSFLTLIVHIV